MARYQRDMARKKFASPSLRVFDAVCARTLFTGTVVCNYVTLCVDEVTLCVDEVTLCVDEVTLCVDEVTLCVDEQVVSIEPGRTLENKCMFAD